MFKEAQSAIFKEPITLDESGKYIALPDDYLKPHLEIYNNRHEITESTAAPSLTFFIGLKDVLNYIFTDPKVLDVMLPGSFNSWHIPKYGDLNDCSPNEILEYLKDYHPLIYEHCLTMCDTHAGTYTIEEIMRYKWWHPVPSREMISQWICNIIKDNRIRACVLCKVLNEDLTDYDYDLGRLFNPFGLIKIAKIQEESIAELSYMKNTFTLDAYLSMTKCLASLLPWQIASLQDLGCGILRARVHKDNVRSNAIVTKFGYSCVGYQQDINHFVYETTLDDLIRLNVQLQNHLSSE